MLKYLIGLFMLSMPLQATGYDVFGIGIYDVKFDGSQTDLAVDFRYERRFDNSLLEKLDSQEIFKAGTTNNGDVFLYGGEMGIEGKLSTIKDGLLNVYSGYCDVGFG